MKIYPRYDKKYYNSVKGYLQRVYAGIRHRCDDPKHVAYRYYGGRGIQNKFKSLNDFRNCVNKLGVDPRGLTIDRIDNDGHYEKNNIRLVTHKENCNNRKRRIGQ